MTSIICGIINNGNTCYLNATLQCFFNMPLLLKYFKTNTIGAGTYIQHLYSHTEFDKLNEIDLERKKKCYSYWTTKSFIDICNTINTPIIINPVDFYCYFKQLSPEFNNNEQHDMSEALLYIINAFHDTLSYEVSIYYNGTPENNTDILMTNSIMSWKKLYEKKYSYMIELFYGQYFISRNNTKSSNVTPESTTSFEPFNIITLSLTTHTTSLIDCLNHYFSNEIINQTVTRNNGVVADFVRTIKMCKTPHYLILLLNRFNDNTSKNCNVVSFPFKLNMQSYIVGYDIDNPHYNLLSIVCHSGNINNGHYYTVCNKNDIWYEFNDTTYTKININDYMNTLYTNAYVLIYEKLISY